MLSIRNSPIQRYGVALLAASFSAGLAFAARASLPGDSSHLLFFAGVAVAAGCGGLGPGILATLVGALAHVFFLIPPIHTLMIPNRGQATELILFFVVGILVSGLSEALREGYRRAEAAREEADSARRRIAFLAQAGALLDASLDYHTTLASVARLAVPYLADWCAIHTLESGETLESDEIMREVAVAHVDPAREDLIHRLEGRYPLNAQGKNPLTKVVFTGQSDVYLDIPDSVLVSTARDPDHLEAMRSLTIRSYLCVPLPARHATLGSILFVSAARQRYGPADAALAEELARRAALAVDNSRLFTASQQEIAERRRAEEELARNQAQIEALNERLQRAMTETHHRVKNNLQIIASMVDMRLLEGAETISAEELRRLGAYIRTLAAVHDVLTQEAKADGQAHFVSAKAVLEKLLPLLKQTAEGRRIEFRLEEACVTGRQGTSLALLVNELVSNAIKYGKETVLVRLLSEDRIAILEVCDNGPGFPAGFDPSLAANTGLELVESLSRWDLGGKAVYSNRPEGGGCVRVTIPLPDLKVPQPPILGESPSPS